MATKGNIFNFEIRNDDVRMRFSCNKTIDRIRKAMDNLCVESGSEKLNAEFVTTQNDTFFIFNGHESESKRQVREALFFENKGFHRASFNHTSEERFLLLFARGVVWRDVFKDEGF